MNNEKESFLKRKNVIISFKRYGIDAMGSMALGLFASLLIGTIINTIGQNICPGSFVSEKLLEIGGYATSVTGAAMALAIGYALQAPPLVMYSLCAVGAACNAIGGSGGPLAVFFVAVLTCEIGKLVSKETKIAMAKGSAMAKTAMCSGEGGILPEEKAAAHKYIFEYVPNQYSVTEENLRTSDAIEIKIGQGTKPGMGGHLPGSKVTPEIAAVRNKPLGEDVISPSKIPGIETREDLRALVSDLRARSDGRPIGIKIAAGKIEKDLEYCVFAEPDFITIDGRGGATGASPAIVRDSTSVPTIYALYRARRYLDSVKSDISLVITGGLRVSSDFAKAIAMGADAVAVASAAMVAAACQQYRICGSGMCPVGVATQDPELRKRLHIEAAAQRVANYLHCSTEELRTFARITGHRNIHDLTVGDLCTISREISEYTNIPHA